MRLICKKKQQPESLFLNLESKLVKKMFLRRNAFIFHRRKSTVPKYDPPYSKKPTPKSYQNAPANHSHTDATLDTVNKIISFGTMPHYKYVDTYFLSTWVY